MADEHGSEVKIPSEEELAELQERAERGEIHGDEALDEILSLIGHIRNLEVRLDATSRGLVSQKLAYELAARRGDESGKILEKILEAIREGTAPRSSGHEKARGG